MFICGLVDGETVVATVIVVTTETNDVVVDAEVVERLDSVVCADVEEQIDVFFLAFSDYIKQPHISTGSRRDKVNACHCNSRQSPDRVLFQNLGSHQRPGRGPDSQEDK